LTDIIKLVKNDTNDTNNTNNTNTTNTYLLDEKDNIYISGVNTIDELNNLLKNYDK
jgi:hypothetical protein